MFGFAHNRGNWRQFSALQPGRRQLKSGPDASRARVDPVLSLGLGVAALMAVSPEALAAGTDPGAALRACVAALEDRTTPTVACQYVAALSDEERTDIRLLTRDLVRDASCTVEVKIDRSLVTPALTATDYAFESPAQPVTCTISTSGSILEIKGTFAPRVTFKKGSAVDGSPGLANVTGVNSYVAWPVVQYVNHSPGIRRDMLAMINAYRGARTAAVRTGSTQR
jgi:hypothetical protein